MKALSIKQPWASLICTPRTDNPLLGIKDIENRTWKTSFRGRVYIHASAKWVPKPEKIGNHGPIYTDEQWNQILENYPKNLSSVLNPKGQYDKLPLSAIIGEVDIIDCVINHPSIWAEKMKVNKCPNTGIQILRKGQKYIWNWVLANPVLYEKPILNVKGKLSFWEPDIDIEECIWCSGKFDAKFMQQDASGENYCSECAKEAFPILQAEYDELLRKGEIDY